MNGSPFCSLVVPRDPDRTVSCLQRTPPARQQMCDNFSTLPPASRDRHSDRCSGQSTGIERAHVASAATPGSHGFIVQLNLLLCSIIVLVVLLVALVVFGLYHNARISQRSNKLPWHRRY